MASVAVAVESGARWREQVVAAALQARGIELRDRAEADVLVLLDGVGAADGHDDGGGGPVMIHPGARSSGADVTRTLPHGCTPDVLTDLVRRPVDLTGSERGVVRRGGLLSPRELQVLRRLADGSSNADIALALGVSRHTVRTHVQNLRAKLGAANRAGAVATAHRLALLT